MPKINPDDYDDDFQQGYSDIVYDGCEDEYDGSDIFKSDLDTEAELEAWENIRQWGHPYINQTWDQTNGMVFGCRIWFGGGTRQIVCESFNTTIEQGLKDLLDEIKESVFKICNS